MSITAKNICKRFGKKVVLDNVTVEARAGTLVALLGPSGSGKTTLLRIIAGLEVPDAGSVLYLDDDVTRQTARDRNIGFVFQHYALFRHMTVRQNVTFGLSVRKVSKPDQQERVDDLLELVGLQAFTDRYPDQLSGGQRQRVALARALAPRPKVLLLDEPFGALDARVRQELRRWLDELHRELGVTSLLVTHDQEEALELANEVVVMRQGEVEQIGTPQAIYNEPATPFVAAFVGASNVLRGVVWEGHVHFGHSAVAGAHHLDDGLNAVAYIRPHDIEITDTPGEMSFPVTVERRTDLGWMSKIHLRLEDGQSLVAQLPYEEVVGVRSGKQLYADLRNAKVFSERETPPAPEGELAGV